jgi:hypothetical protein
MYNLFKIKYLQKIIEQLFKILYKTLLNYNFRSNESRVKVALANLKLDEVILALNVQYQYYIKENVL